MRTFFLFLKNLKKLKRKNVRQSKRPEFYKIMGGKRTRTGEQEISYKTPCFFKKLLLNAFKTALNIKSKRSDFYA